MMLLPALFNGLLFAGAFVMKVDADIPIRIISHNIRYATTSPFTGRYLDMIDYVCIVSSV